MVPPMALTANCTCAASTPTKNINSRGGSSHHHAAFICSPAAPSCASAALLTSASACQAEAWAAILNLECLAGLNHASKMGVIGKAMEGTIELSKLIKIVCMIQGAFKRYKEKKRKQMLERSNAMSFYTLSEQLRHMERDRNRQFQELKERMHRLSEQQYRLFSELLYQHKFASVS